MLSQRNKRKCCNEQKGCTNRILLQPRKPCVPLPFFNSFVEYFFDQTSASIIRVVPFGATSCNFVIIGGGGGGAGGLQTDPSGAGGGGGGYAGLNSGSSSLIGISTITIVIGNGGVGGATDIAGSNGQPSILIIGANPSLIANGGFGGLIGGSGIG